MEWRIGVGIWMLSVSLGHTAAVAASSPLPAFQQLMQAAHSASPEIAPAAEPVPKTIWDLYPEREYYRLRDGTKFRFPVRIKDSDYVFLGGFADLQAVKKILKDENLDPVVYDGKAYIGIYGVHVKEGNTGPYYEYLIGFSVRSQLDPERSGFYVWNIAVTSELALDLGVEIWGYPKTRKEISFDVGEDSIEVKASKRAGGKPFLRLSCHQCGRIPTEPRVESFVNVTPFGIRRNWQKFFMEGPVGTRPFDPQHDEWFVDPRTKLGKEFQSLEFQPQVWSVGLQRMIIGLRHFQ